MPTLMGVYLLTMPPSITWAHWGADGGDLATAVTRGRLPHPPGFPTYLLLGAASMWLPWGDSAWRLNLLSALSAAGAAVLTATAVRWLSLSTIASVIAGLCLGLAPLFWSQALIAEVYAPAALLSAAVLFLASRPAPDWLRGLLWGLGTGVHPTLLFLAPLVVGNHGLKDVSTFTRVHLRPVLFALLTAGVLYGPVLLAWGMAPSPWADFSTPAGWWAYVSGRLYHGYLFGLPLAFWPRRLLAWVGLLARQFTPIGALLALWGWMRLWRDNRRLALATALSFGLFTFYAIGYNTTDSLVYLTPALPLMALWLGTGLDGLLRGMRCRLSRLYPYTVSCFLLLLALRTVLLWGQMDVHRDRSAISWALDTLRAAPPDAILLTVQDGATFALWYVQEVLNERPDVRIVDQDLLGHAPYRRFLSVEWGIDPTMDFGMVLGNSARPIITVWAPLKGGP